MILTDFLLARIAEDEVDAKAIRDCEWYHGVESDAEAEVQRLSDPARVLAECEAKRRIVDALVDPGWDGDRYGIGGNDWYVLAFLALPYADHPDYRQEWRPSPPSP